MIVRPRKMISLEDYIENIAKIKKKLIGFEYLLKFRKKLVIFEGTLCKFGNLQDSWKILDESGKKEPMTWSLDITSTKIAFVIHLSKSTNISVFHFLHSDLAIMTCIFRYGPITSSRRGLYSKTFSTFISSKARTHNFAKESRDDKSMIVRMSCKIPGSILIFAIQRFKVAVAATKYQWIRKKSVTY